MASRNSRIRRIVVKSTDEIGDLAKWFNEFVESIQNIIRLVAGTANRVVATSEELGSTSQEVTAGAQEISWDGRDEGGRLLPPGLYLMDLNLRAEHGTIRHIQPIGVAY